MIKPRDFLGPVASLLVAFLVASPTDAVLAQDAQAQVVVQGEVSSAPQVVVQGEVVPPPPQTAPSPVLTLTTSPVVVQEMPAPGTQATPYAMPAPTVQTERRMIMGLAIAGGVTFGAAWVVNIFGAALGTIAYTFGGWPSWMAPDDLFGSSFIPVIGPLLFGAASLDDGQDALATFAFVDAAVQAAGLAMLIAGIVGEETEVTAYGENQLRVLPYASAQSAGLTLTGSF